MSYRCVEQARNLQIVSISCEAIVHTLTGKLIQKLGFETNRVVDVVEDLLSLTALVSLPETIPAVSGDPEDDVVLACAVAGAADYIVSGDKRHLQVLRVYQSYRFES